MMDDMSIVQDDSIRINGSSGSPRQEILYAPLHIATVAEPTPVVGMTGSADASESDTEDSDEADADIYGREDVEGVMGPSISRAASYIAASRTHPTEKEAVNMGEDDTFYDSNGATGMAGRTTTIPTSYIPASPAPAEVRTPQVRVEVKHKQLSTNHHNTHISFLGVKRSLSKRSASGAPAGRTRRALSNGGDTLKRFLPSLPSMVKAGSYMPSLPSPLFGASHRHQKRNSLHGKVEGMDRSSSLHNCLGSYSRRASISGHVPTKNNSENDLVADQDFEERPELLTRVTSDNTGLYTSMSRVVIHGDDSRWVNQREMVNSRFKAIMDSLEDRASFRVPSFKVPSIPAMPTFDLSFGKEDKEKKTSAKKRSPESSTTTLPIPEPKDELDKALATLTGDVVIMGGYRGSILRSAKQNNGHNRRLWVPVKVGLNIRKVNLEVGLSEEDEERMEESIFASGMLQNIGPVDISRRLIKRMQECDNAKAGKLRVWDYGYDWRLSPHLLARKLQRFLEGLACNQPDAEGRLEGATVIAHSLGGLITRYVVNQRPELFKGVIYAGTPQACINILGPLRNGDEVLLSSKVLTAQVNFSLRTSFLLLPTHGRGFFDKSTGEGIPLDFFDVNHWIKYRFSPCIDPPLPAYTKGKDGILSSLGESLGNISMPGRKQSNSISKSSSSPTVSRQTSNDLDTTTQTSTSTSASGPSDKENLAQHAAHKVEQGARNAVPAKVSINPDMASSPSAPPANHQHIDTHLNPPIKRDDAIAYLARILPQIRQFKLDLQHREELETSNAYPPFAVLYGHSCATVASVRVFGSAADGFESSVAATDVYDDLGFGDGDGVVLVREAMLAEGYRVVRGGIRGSERGHLGLCGDLVAMGELLGAVGRGRDGGIGMGKGV